jgi:tRNA(fMet)-specific endonuclease VapC
MYLLDTTHCLGLLFGFPNVVGIVESLDEAEISTNVAVCGELLYGVYKSAQVDKNLDDIEKFLRQIIIHDINKDTSKVYAKLKAGILDRFGPKDQRKRRNTAIESLGFKDNDVWIAATAIQHNLILVSGDSDIMRLCGIEGLRVENW